MRLLPGALADQQQECGEQQTQAVRLSNLYHQAPGCLQIFAVAGATLRRGTVLPQDGIDAIDRAYYAGADGDGLERISAHAPGQPNSTSFNLLNKPCTRSGKMSTRRSDSVGGNLRRVDPV